MNIEERSTEELSNNILSSNSNTSSFFATNKKKSSFDFQKIFVISLILFILSFITFMLSFINKKNEKPQFYEKPTIRRLKRKLTGLMSEKWVVVTTINAPTPSIHKLTELPEPWKIVIVGDKKTKNEDWKIFEGSNKLVFLSVETQVKLNYKTTKYIPYNSYTRKNIGYLYAIEHGAKEIYETDDDNIFTTFDQLYNNFNFSKVSYAENNITVMINPYAYYGRPTVWPRGFRLNDIGYEWSDKFYISTSEQITSKPLVYQGLANGDPDVDAIFRLTRANAQYPIKLDFYDLYPLLYFPGNYIPTNSQNTRFLYEAFPALALPTTVAFRVCDIWRGFIMERFIWGYNGTVLFHSPSVYQKRNVHDYYLDFVDEEALYYGLEDILNGLNTEIKKQIYNPGHFMVSLIEVLVKNNVLKENDLKMYKAFIEDLETIGYNYSPNYSTKINYDHKQFLKISSEMRFYTPRKQRELMRNNGKEETHKVLYHYSSNTVFKDILLIINFYNKDVYALKDYMFKLYKKNFPNIVFISSTLKEYKDQNGTHIIYCPEANDTSLSYICIRKVYEQYLNMKGYLYLNNEILLKIWELDNFDLNLPWVCSFNITNDTASLLRPEYQNMQNVLNAKENLRENLKKFLGKEGIATGMPHFYYLPKNAILKFIEISNDMYKNKVPQELAVPNTMGMILLPHYQYIYFADLTPEDIKNVMKYIKKIHEQILVYPVDYTREDYRKEIDKYIYFMKAEEY